MPFSPRILRYHLLLVVLAALVLVAFLGAAYLAVCGAIVWSMVIPRRTGADRTSPQPGLPAAEAIAFESDDGVPLKGELLPSTGDRAVVLVHGIHSHRWDGQAPELARALSEAGFHVLVLDLRGHGRSGGETLGLGVREGEDVAAAVDFLLDRGFEPGTIGVHGLSYGAAATLHAAASRPEVGAIVADSAFADIREVAGGEIRRQTVLPGWAVAGLMPGLGLMARSLLSIDLAEASPALAAARISSRPILLIHGDSDPITPVDHARRLGDATPAAELWILPGRQHTEGIRLAPDYSENSPLRDAYLHKVTDFFDRSLRTTEPGIPQGTESSRAASHTTSSVREFRA
jgi:dipeptidyl aminopeptidase/acylaminoacyl peptidase